MLKAVNAKTKTKAIIGSKYQSLKTNFSFFTKRNKLQEELDLLTSYSSDTVYRLRYDSMTYDYVSPAITRLLGYNQEEMKKINFRSLITETKIISDGFRTVRSYDELEKSRKNGNVNKWQADYLIRRKDGRKIWLTDISYPWLDKNGKIIGSVGSLRDITERVHAEILVTSELVRLAHTDSLTGLANRQSFFDTIGKEIKRVKRSGNHFSILLVDVDHFKKVNDTYGHLSGDRVINDMARIMKSCVRDSDIVARIGGEEFGIFLPDTPENGAFWVADRICNNVSRHNFFVEKSILPIKCTVSIGVSSSESSAEVTPTELYKRADMRLYIAKNTGRNQVSVDEIMQLH